MTHMFDDSDVDVDAFRRELLGRARKLLRRYQTVDRSIDPDDLAQETLMRLEERERSKGEVDSRKSFAFATMHNYVRDRSRRLGKETSRDKISHENDERDDESRVEAFLVDLDTQRGFEDFESPPNVETIRRWGTKWRSQAETIKNHWDDGGQNNYFAALVVLLRQNICIALADTMVGESFEQWSSLHDLVTTLYPWSPLHGEKRSNWHAMLLKDREGWPEIGEIWTRMWNMYKTSPESFDPVSCARCINDIVDGRGSMTETNWYKWGERSRRAFQNAYETSGLANDERSRLWHNLRIRASSSDSQ
jgi:hypothetical protein